MKDMDGFILALTAILGIAICYFIFTNFIKKAVSTPHQSNIDENYQLMRDQKQRMDDIRRQQRRHMDQQRQKIRDLKRR